MNATQSAILRALSLAKVLDVEHTAEEAHRAFRAVRHELETLRALHGPKLAEETRTARVGKATQPGSLRHKILGVLSFRPMADFEIATELRRDTQAPSLHDVRRRRHELAAAGWVEPVVLGSGYRKVRHEATGRDCTVYALTDLGVAALQRLRSGQEVLFTVRELSGNG